MKFIRKSILCFHCLLLCVPLTAQTSRIDSLKQVLASGRLKNQENMTYINLALMYALMHNIDSAEYYINKAKVWHECDQIEHEKSFLQQEYHKAKKLTLILSIALVVILVLLTFVVFVFRKTTEKNHEMKDLHRVKDKLFSVVAHDLRIPVASLISVLKLINEQMLDIKTQTKILKDISKRAEDVYGLLDNLLHWAKSQMQGIVMTPVYFDVQNETRTITDSLKNIAEDKMIILNNYTEKQEIYADRDMFLIVIRNLAINALKYTPAGGEVTINSKLSGNSLVISVKDTGTGMSQEVKDKLFKLSINKSQRGTDNESGVGLGLILCADFAKANGGRIWFTSVQGEGSTFFFSIPVKN